MHVVFQSFAAISTRDVAYFDHHISNQLGTHALGTDPSEWWADAAAIREGVAEAAGLNFDPGGVQAWRKGSVGWVVTRDAWFRRPDGHEVPFRYTGVYHLEDGTWRLVQGHWSLGVPNIEAGLVGSSTA